MPEKRIQPYRDFPPVEPIEIPERFSQTFLAKYECCPRSAYLYAKYKGGASSIPLERGSFFHEFAERATNTMLVEDEPAFPYDGPGRELYEAMVAETDYVIPFGEYDALGEMIYHWCTATRIPKPRETILVVEGLVAMKIAGVVCRGRIDLALTRGLLAEVIDYKTRWAPGEQKAFAKFQTAFYSTAIATGSINGAPTLDHLTYFDLIEQYPRHLWTEDGNKVLAYRDAVVDRERIVAFRAYLEAVVNKAVHSFETWDFRAVEGEHCDVCPCRAECPIPAHLRRKSFRPEMPEIENDEQAAEVASRRFFTAKQQRWDLDALNAYCSRPNFQGGLRFGKDLVLEWESTTKRELDREGLIAAAERAAVFGEPFDPESYFKVSHSTGLKQRTLSEDELAKEAGEESSE